MSDRIPHTLRAAGRTSIPHLHLWFSTASTPVENHGAVEHRWLWGIAAGRQMRPDRPEREIARSSFATADELADWIDANAPGRAKTCIWTHDLPRHLRIGALLATLPERGWTLDGIVLERTAAWCGWRNGDRTLLFLDLQSWTPAPLPALAGDLNVATLPPPADADELTAAVCALEHASEVLSAAVVTLVHYLRNADLGPFRPTGAGQSHAAYRKNHMKHKLFCHDDEQLLVDERRAAWTGRCECWRHGRLQGGPWTEYDVQLAYCHIARECAVPTQLVGEVTIRSVDEYLGLAKRYAVLADVLVRTQTPLVPADVGGFIVWPVGSFRTTLWNPELELLIDKGATIVWDRVHVYRRDKALEHFAAWIMDRLPGGAEPVGPFVGRMMKHWSRTLVGRMALRYRQWEAWGTAEHNGVSLSTLLDTDTGEATDLLQAGKDLFVLDELREADSSLPQITGYVMSEARARLWALAEIAGTHNVVYLDTDSLIVTPDGARRLDRAIKRRRAWSLHEKARYGRLELRGPRNLTTERASRISGVPLSAVRTGPDTMEGTIWRGLKESLSRGELDHVAATSRTFKVVGVDRRRTHWPDGTTSPPIINAP